ncbi:two-component response regulator [Piscinibacter sakaiensis]|uniref:Two-component response regulator n=1 Tax=Piscinibacter sakaiensis TaxID=1547922 RepID=A0A0K8P1X4_PISS1|nr:two-component response regulator [Piscinibacter sakaiensis]
MVDDHDIVRLGVRHALAGRAETVDAADLVEARQKLAAEPFALLLLDLALADGFSLKALPQLRALQPGLRIVVLTSMEEDLYAERALRAGADGFVMKAAPRATLLEAVDTVLAGGVFVSAGLNARLLRRAVQGEPAAARDPLSTREIEVLRLVAAGHSTREIAERLNRSVKTIESHKAALKAKLGADSPAMLVRLALGWLGDSA